MALQTVGAEFVARKKIDKGMDRGARNIYSGVRTQMRTLEFGLKE